MTAFCTYIVSNDDRSVLQQFLDHYFCAKSGRTFDTLPVCLTDWCNVSACIYSFNCHRAIAEKITKRYTHHSCPM